MRHFFSIEHVTAVQSLIDEELLYVFLLIVVFAEHSWPLLIILKQMK